MLFRVEHPGTLPNLRNETGRDIFSVQRNHQGMVFFFKNGPLNLQVQDLLSLFKVVTVLGILVYVLENVGPTKMSSLKATALPALHSTARLA